MKTDAQLHKNILDALTFEPSLDASNIGIAVSDGVVTLTGEVTSYGDRWTAERICKNVAGVRGLVENLTVNLPAHHTRTDTEIAQAVLSALKWDVNVPHESLQVKVKDGWVTLSGTVTWQFQRQHAESDSRYITGVRGVTNLIQIKPDIAPRDVKARIELALNRQARIDARHIHVDVSGSRVILRGTVTAVTEREEAAQAAWSAAGVTEVTNEIKVEPWLAHAYSAIDALPS